jgi:uncharacterized protein YecE (DUF72 family)
MLPYFASRFGSVEINYTFRQQPAEKTLVAWREATPEGFVFALKAHQRITHWMRLAGADEAVSTFLDRIRLLGPRLGPILFQVPPWLKRDDERLAMFLASLPRDLRSVLEVRHPSWYVPEVYDLLRTINVPLVHAEGEKSPSPLDTIGATADFVYVRLRRREGYSRARVRTWARRLREILESGKDVYAYFRHDDDGANALAAIRLRDALT